MSYNSEQFEAAFQLITAVSHQIIKIDFSEVENWVDKLMGSNALKDPEIKKNMENLKGVMKAYRVMQKTLLTNGVPVRNIENYTEQRITKDVPSA